MSDQILPYTPGTLVWFKVHNRIWWPAKVVDPTTAPLEIQYYMNKKKNPIAMVYFQSDKKYDIVINLDKVTLYSCSKKMEFLEKGYSLYKKQMNGAKIQSLNMVHFVDDVVKFENEIGGDINVFANFENTQEDHATPNRELLIKQLFVSGKQNKKKQINTNSNNSNSLKISKKPNLKKRVSSTQISGNTESKLHCYFNPGECNFTTNRYEVLKRHHALCKLTVKDKTEENELNINTLFETPTKQTNTTKQDNNQKSKICHKLLQKCNDGENQDNIKSLNHNAEPGSSISFIENKNVKNVNKVSDLDEINKSNNSEIIKMFENVAIQRKNQDDIVSLNHNTEPGSSTSFIKNTKDSLNKLDFDEIKKRDDIQRELFNNRDISESSNIDEIFENIKRVVNERFKPCLRSTDSKTNNNSDGQLKNSNHITDSKNDCFNLVNNSETVQHIGNESHELIEPSVESLSKEQDHISDQSLFVNETRNDRPFKFEIPTNDSGINLKEICFKNDRPFKFQIPGNDGGINLKETGFKNDVPFQFGMIGDDGYIKENVYNINSTEDLINLKDKFEGGEVRLTHRQYLNLPKTEPSAPDGDLLAAKKPSHAIYRNIPNGPSAVNQFLQGIRTYYRGRTKPQ